DRRHRLEFVQIARELRKTIVAQVTRVDECETLTRRASSADRRWRRAISRIVQCERRYPDRTNEARGSKLQIDSAHARTLATIRRECGNDTPDVHDRHGRTGVYCANDRELRSAVVACIQVLLHPHALGLRQRAEHQLRQHFANLYVLTIIHHRETP